MLLEQSDVPLKSRIPLTLGVEQKAGVLAVLWCLVMGPTPNTSS